MRKGFKKVEADLVQITSYLAAHENSAAAYYMTAALEELVGIAKSQDRRLSRANARIKALENRPGPGCPCSDRY